MLVGKDYFEEFEMDLTGVCNLSCPLCSRNYTHAQHMVHKNIRPLREIIDQLEQFPNLKRTFLAGQVSEPTLYPEFLDYLRYLKSRKIYIELFTNGSTRNVEFWKEVAEILDDNDQVHFTICGSTQELHEKYRVGSSLQKILENAEAVRSIKPIDYCQFIRFRYNKNDEDNVKNFPFSNYYRVESEGDRYFNDVEKEYDKDIRPLETRDKTIKWIFDNKPSVGEIKCKSIEDKKIYISQDGRISACYIHYEYEPKHTFNIFENFDYSEILDFRFSSCFLCEKRTKFKIEKMGLDFVC